MATGGSIQGVALAGRAFAATSDADFSIFLGGFNNETLANGDGATAREIKTRMPWKVTGVVLALDLSAGDLDFVQSLADGEPFAIAITMPDDTEYKGTGQIQGDFTHSTQSAAVTLELSGPGKLTA
jgi:hypothetical protein